MSLCDFDSDFVRILRESGWDGSGKETIDTCRLTVQTSIVNQLFVRFRKYRILSQRGHMRGSRTQRIKLEQIERLVLGV